MQVFQQPRHVNVAIVGKQLKDKGNASVEFPYRPVIQARHQGSAAEDAESDSKSVQVPSLSMGDSSRASSINNHECRAEADDFSRWLPHEDEHVPILERSSSPVSMEEPDSQRTPMELFALVGRRACEAQQMPDISEVTPKTISNKRDASMEPQSQRLISSGEPLPAGSAVEESKALSRQSTLDSEMSDSDSESEEDSGDDDIDNDEWSGANDNIEAALYQAVYPDIDLAAHMVLTMYPTLVLSYRKKITKKVSSWQEKNINTCGTGSGTASTATDAAPQGTSNTGNGTSPKRDRQSSSSDDNVGEDEDDDADESRRKRSKEQSDSDLGIPKPRFACPFYKKDPVRYSAAESGRKSCSGPGWTSISQMKEHLHRAHRPVQCGRCYRIFPFKAGDRSSAVSELEQHIQQDDRCPRQPVSLKEGITDAEWSRLSEEKKKNRKGKGKRKVITTEQTQSPFEQWYEIWAVLCPNIPRPSTPWYPPLHPRGLPQNEHFLNVSKNVNEFKLSAIKDAISSGSDDVLRTLLLECDQQKYSLYRSTFMAISDTTTDSFSNIEENDLHSSGGCGSWQKVTKEADTSQQPSSQPASDPLLSIIGFPTQTDHSTPISMSNPGEAMIDGREISMNANPQSLTPNATYTLENVQGSPQQLSSQTATTPVFQDLHVGTHINHSARANLGMDGSLQHVSRNSAYIEPPQVNYNYDTSGYTAASQAAYPNGSLGSIWSPDIYDMQVPGDFDMTSSQTASLQNHRWGDQYLNPSVDPRVRRWMGR